MKMLECERIDILEGMLICQINQNNVCFVIIGIFYIKTLAMDPIFAMGAVI